MTTYRAFVDALEALDITGVERQYTQGPPMGAPDVPDCPFQYVRYPGGEEISIVFGAHGGWPTLRADLVVGVEPVGASTGFENFDLAVDIMGNMATALQNTTCVAKSKLRWSIRQTIDTIAGKDYWAVVANVEGNG